MPLSTSDQIAILSVIGVYIGIFISVFEMWHPFRQRAGDTASDPESSGGPNPPETLEHPSSSVLTSLSRQMLDALDFVLDMDVDFHLFDFVERIFSLASTALFPRRRSKSASTDTRPDNGVELTHSRNLDIEPSDPTRPSPHGPFSPAETQP
ncbi:hypothetical protein HDK77DRAFT_479343 [Phyllosticta capitalensis]